MDLVGAVLALQTLKLGSLDGCGIIGAACFLGGLGQRVTPPVYLLVTSIFDSAVGLEEEQV